MANRIVFWLFVLSAVYTVHCSTRIKREDDNAFLNAAVGSVEAATRAIEKYNQDLDQSISWKNLTAAVDEINKDIDHYSEKAKPFLPRIREGLTNGLHKYFEASKKVYQWTVSASSGLSNYLNNLESKSHLISVLDNGVIQLSESISDLNGVSMDFDQAHNELLSLKDQMKIDFDESSDFFRKEIEVMRVAGHGASAGIATFAGLAAGVLAAAFCGPCGFFIGGATGAAVEGTGAGVTEGVWVQNLKHRFGLITTFYTDMGEKVNNAKGVTVTTQTATKNEVLKMI